MLSETRRREHEVLVVEDDPDLRHMMVEILTLEGFHTQVALDGQDALDHLRARALLPDIILLDMMMPRMDGWQFRLEQQADPALRDIAVVVLSAAPLGRLNVGAAEVIIKPFDYDILMAAIRRLCCSSGASDGEAG